MRNLFASLAVLLTAPLAAHTARDRPVCLENPNLSHSQN